MVGDDSHAPLIQIQQLHGEEFHSLLKLTNDDAQFSIDEIHVDILENGVSLQQAASDLAQQGSAPANIGSPLLEAAFADMIQVLRKSLPLKPKESLFLPIDFLAEKYSYAAQKKKKKNLLASAALQFEHQNGTLFFALVKVVVCVKIFYQRKKKKTNQKTNKKILRFWFRSTIAVVLEYRNGSSDPDIYRRAQCVLSYTQQNEGLHVTNVSLLRPAGQDFDLEALEKLSEAAGSLPHQAAGITIDVRKTKAKTRFEHSHFDVSAAVTPS